MNKRTMLSGKGCQSEKAEANLAMKKLKVVSNILNFLGFEKMNLISLFEILFCYIVYYMGHRHTKNTVCFAVA